MSFCTPEGSPAADSQRLKTATPCRRARFLEYALSSFSPGVLEKRANGNHLFQKPIASEKVGDYSVNFAVSPDTALTVNAKVSNAMREYLAFTGLLFRGFE